MTVVLAVDDVAAREDVRVGLEHHGFDVVAEAGDADEAVAAARRHCPQLCVLDVDIRGGGIHAADRINAELPETKIAMLSASIQPVDLHEAVLAGADGYLPLSMPPDRLTAALTGLINGEAAMPRSATGQLLDELRDSERRYRSAPPHHEPGHSSADDHSGPASAVLYVPRFMHHFRRRRRSGMTIANAWRSARARMRHYT